jgi:hypothetical protein
VNKWTTCTLTRQIFAAVPTGWARVHTKTLQSLALHLLNGQGGPALIVAPARLRDMWIKDLERIFPSATYFEYKNIKQTHRQSNSCPSLTLSWPVSTKSRENSSVAQILHAIKSFANCGSYFSQREGSCQTRGPRASRTTQEATDEDANRPPPLRLSGQSHYR